MAMKVFGDDNKGAEATDILAALEDAIILGADVINMSLSSPRRLHVVKRRSN